MPSDQPDRNTLNQDLFLGFVRHGPKQKAFQVLKEAVRSVRDLARVHANFEVLINDGCVCSVGQPTTQQ